MSYHSTWRHPQWTGSTEFSVCDRCGALVDDTTRHDAWHDDVVEYPSGDPS